MSSRRLIGTSAPTVSDDTLLFTDISHCNWDKKNATFRKPISYSFQLSYIKSIVLLITLVNNKGMSEVKPQSQTSERGRRTEH